MDNLKSLTQKKILFYDIARKVEHRKLILEWTKNNLTAITDEEAMNTKTFLDCLYIL